MLVASVCASSPPLTTRRPSGRKEVPGQNMLWTVLVMVFTTTLVGRAGSKSAVTVWSSAPLPAKRVPRQEAQVITLRSGRSAAEIGTTPFMSMTPLQRPLASEPATKGCFSTVQRNLLAVPQAIWVSGVPLVPLGDCRQRPPFVTLSWKLLPVPTLDAVNTVPFMPAPPRAQGSCTKAAPLPVEPPLVRRHLALCSAESW